MAPQTVSKSRDFRAHGSTVTASDLNHQLSPNNKPTSSTPQKGVNNNLAIRLKRVSATDVVSCTIEFLCYI